jgi:predicted dehydrogenase
MRHIPLGTEAYTNHQEMIDKGNVDLVIVFAPHHLCPEIAEYAASHGKHLIIEKPMANTLAGGQRIAKACEKYGVLGSTPYIWRYHAAAKQIKGIVSQGYIGEIQALEGRCIAGRIQRYIDAGASWMLKKSESGGGVMWNLGVHWIDLFRWFMEGAEVERVYAEYSASTPNVNVEENAFALVRYHNGAVATLNIGYSSPPSFPYGRDLHINVRGTLGSITWNPAFEGSEDEIFICSDHPDMCDAPNRTMKFVQKRSEGYSGVLGLNYINDIAECIVSKREPPISVLDGVEALKVANAINHSAEERKVVFV